MPERSPEAKARRAERARERYLEKDFEWPMGRLYPGDYSALMMKELTS